MEEGRPGHTSTQCVVDAFDVKPWQLVVVQFHLHGFKMFEDILYCTSCYIIDR